MGNIPVNFVKKKKRLHEADSIDVARIRFSAPEKPRSISAESVENEQAEPYPLTASRI